MTNNTLKSTIEAIQATGALVVVTTYGMFNSKTDQHILPQRASMEQHGHFLKQYCDRVPSSDINEVRASEKTKLDATVESAKAALVRGEYVLASKLAQQAAEQSEMIDEPRSYYRLKENLDLRTVAEKRAAKKAENAEKKADKQATKEAAAAAKLTVSIQPQTDATPEPVEHDQQHKSAKGKKAA